MYAAHSAALTSYEQVRDHRYPKLPGDVENVIRFASRRESQQRIGRPTGTSPRRRQDGRGWHGVSCHGGILYSLLYLMDVSL